VRDRAWLGRLLIVTGNRVWIENSRFDFGHPLITNGLRCRALLGRYERSERELLRRYLHPNYPVVELGGGLGVIACLTNRVLSRPENHIVVEANSALIPVVERHRAWNGCDFTVVNAAVDYSGRPHATLHVEDSFISGRLGSGEGIRVPALTLSQLLEEYPFPACTLVCDIEGAETALVRFEGHVLASHVVSFIVETHPKFTPAAEIRVMVDALESLGFSQVAAVRKVRVFENRRLRAEPGAPSRVPPPNS
jgi:hypothetical protein